MSFSELAAGETADAEIRTRLGLVELAFVAGGALYLWLFFTTTIPSLGVDPESGQALSRFEFQWLLIQNPGYLVRQWTGGDWSRFGLLDRAPVLAVALSIFLLALAPGRLLLRAMGLLSHLSNLEAVVFSLATGLNLLSLWTLAVGLMGRLHSPIALTAPWFAAALVECVFMRRTRRPHPEVSRSHSVRDRAAWPLLWLTPFALLLLLGAMLPPMKYDARCYHLQIPKEWFLNGAVDFVPHNVYGNMPLGAEMHALLAMAITPLDSPWWWGALAGKTVIAGFTILTAVSLYAAGIRFGSRQVGLIAALLCLSTPWLAYVSTSGLIDGVVAGYFWLSVYAVLMHRRARRRNELKAVRRLSDGDSGSAIAPTHKQDREALGWLLASGFLAGSAVACKYPAAAFVATPLAILVLFLPSRAKLRGVDLAGNVLAKRLNWRNAILFCLLTLAACGPWLAKNVYLTGNPTYPLLYEVFGGRNLSEASNRQWRSAHSPQRDLQGAAYSPAQAFGSLRQFAWRSNWLSPLLLPLALFAFCTRRGRALALPIGLLVVAYLIGWWLLTHRVDRFWLPVLPPLAMLAGIGAVRSNSLRPAINIVLLLGLGSNLLLMSSRALGDNRFLTGLSVLRNDEPFAGDAFYSRTNPFHRYLNALPDGPHKVLLVGDAKPFDLEIDAVYNSAFNQCELERLIRGKTREQRLRALQGAGITHVFVSWRDIDQERSGEGYGFTEYISRELIRKELVHQQQLFRKVDLELHPEFGELFEVAAK